MKALLEFIFGFYLMKNFKWTIPIVLLMSYDSRKSEYGCLFFVLIISIFLIFWLIALIVMAIPV